MNLHPVFDWRNKRNINPISIQTMNYSTYSLPDFTANKKINSEIYMYDQDFKISEMEDKKFDKSEKSESWLIKSALNMCALIFKKISGRASSPDLSYHDCETVPGQESPSMWRSAKTENKNIEAHSAAFTYSDRGSDMNGDYQSVVASCEDKLSKVRQLITSKPVPSSPKLTTYRSRRRRRVFVESSSVEDSFEDAFCPEDFITNSKSDPLTYIIPLQYQNCELFNVDAPKMKIETPVMNLTSQSVQENKEDLNLKPELVKTEVGEHIEPEKEGDKTNIETVSSCESKIMQLQAMLKERRKKNTKTMLNSSDSASESVKDLPTEHTNSKIIPTPKTQDKRYKNRHRLSTGKRKKAETKKLIQGDMLFADEIAEVPSSFENSPIIPVNLDKVPLLDKSVENLGTTPEDCFDEVAGRFWSASGTESDDSFQVVFADSPRAKRPSDCESEDSFIFFEDSPDSCYTSNDVFGDESDSEYSDTDSEISDSGCGHSDEMKISQNMTKTFADLTDDKLYDEDVVDSAVKMCVEIPTDDLDLDAVSVKSTGLLLNDAKKLMRKDQPAKKVHFSEQPPKVHVMRVWAFAARQARAGHWERHALDRERFKRRIADADMALSWVLKPQHRSRVMFQRFMPWWNAQRRKELAEKKQKEADEKKRLEQEAVKEELRLEEEKTRIEEEKSNAKEENGIKGETTDFVNDHKDAEEKQRNIDEIHADINDKNKNMEKGTVQNVDLKNIDEIRDKSNHCDKKVVGIKKENGAKNEIKKSKIVSDVTRTNYLNKEKSLKANTVNSVNKTQTDKVKNMEIVLRDDKCSIIPLAVHNEVIS